MITTSKSSHNKKAKRKRLPKDFEKLLESGDIAALKAVFDVCDVNARGGYSKGTALMLRHCPEELVRWLVAQGADLAAIDDFGSTALHSQARYLNGCVETLIELGADVNCATPSSGTPLHAAVDAKQAAHVATLLAHGANVNATNRDGLTALEYGLQRASNIDLKPIAEIARTLLSGGASNSGASRKFVAKLGQTFEFHRASFNRDWLEEASNALDALYEMFDVEPEPRRQLHDGKAPIRVNATTWQAQYEELWNLLVPSQGVAATVQGEVIRIAGRIGDEIHGNGGVNWDPQYERMARVLCGHLRTGRSLPASQLDQCESIVRSVIESRNGDTDRLAECAVAWILLNPEPIALIEPTYSR